MMGAGKIDASAPRLAERLGPALPRHRCRDRGRAGAPVAEIFARDGEPHFRALERAAIEALSRARPRSWRSGAARSRSPARRERLADRRTVVYLRARPETLLARIGDADEPAAAAPASTRPGARARLARAARARASPTTLRPISRSRRDGRAIDALADELAVRLGRALGATERSVTIDAAHAAQARRVERPCRSRSASAATRSGSAGERCPRSGERDRRARREARGRGRDRAAGRPPLRRAALRSLRAAGLAAARIVVPDGDRTQEPARRSRELYEALPRRRRRPRHRRSSRSAAAWSATSRASPRRRYLRGASLRAGADDAARDDRLLRRRARPASTCAAGKNLVGAFHQPRAGLRSTRRPSRSLPRRVRAAGLRRGDQARRDPRRRALRAPRARPRARPRALSPRSLLAVLERAVADQGRAWWRQDEREEGVRMLLNFGHTLAHAVEALRGYRGVLHGEAVGDGDGLRGAALGGAGNGPAGHGGAAHGRSSSGRISRPSFPISRAGLIYPPCASIRRSGTRASGSWCCGGSARRTRCRCCPTRSFRRAALRRAPRARQKR